MDEDGHRDFLRSLWLLTKYVDAHTVFAARVGFTSKQLLAGTSESKRQQHASITQSIT